MPIQNISTSTISGENSSFAPLLGSATYTGIWIDTLPYHNININVSSNVPGTLNVEFSQDAVITDSIAIRTYTGIGTGIMFAFAPLARYFRIRYVNGATAQTFFRLESRLMQGGNGAILQPLSQALVAGNLAMLVRSVQDGEKPDGSFGHLQMTTAGELLVSSKTKPVFINKTGTVTTTAVTADQVVLTYATANPFFLKGFNVFARPTVVPGNANPVLHGTASLETPSGTKLHTFEMAGGVGSAMCGINFDKPIFVAAGTVIRLVCTPAATTSFLWRANLWGFED